MSNTIIKVEGLGKKYMLGHQTKEKYTSLRDVITSNVKNAFRHTKDLISGGHAIEGDTEEEFWALRDLNFEINKGDRVGIIGRNGAGKSTLLKVLSRITEPTTGKVTINGRVASLLEVGTGFHPELSGRENIFLNGAILGMSRREIRSKFDEIVAFAEVEKFLDTPVKRYSSGMYVRLAFAVAAHLEPEILIVDEVLAVGDAQFQKKCLGKMEDVSRNEGRTVLFVSHNLGVLSQFCSTAIYLRNGNLVDQNNIQSILHKYISSTQTENASYKFDFEKVKNKEAYFLEIKTVDEKGNEKNDYAFNETIIVRFGFKLSRYDDNLQIGIGLNNKYQSRVFTVIKPISHFCNSKGEYWSEVQFPSDLIAPNSYSFDLALWTKSGEVIDFIDNVCPIQIHDNGTELAYYEGKDNGSIVVEAIWNKL